MGKTHCVTFDLYLNTLSSVDSEQIFHINVARSVRLINVEKVKNILSISISESKQNATYQLKEKAWVNIKISQISTDAGYTCRLYVDNEVLSTYVVSAVRVYNNARVYVGVPKKLSADGIISNLYISGKILYSM